MRKRKIIIITLIIFVILAIFLFLTVGKTHKSNDKVVFTTGLSKGQAESFQRELNSAFSQYSYIRTGDIYYEKGNFPKALEQYEIALSLARTSGSKGEAYRCLGNVYEKQKDYAKALEYRRIELDKYVAEWGKQPLLEEVKYLEYALQGNYEMAVKHAELALEEDKKLPNRPKEGSPSYIERLNDIKASKEYIESLKNN